MIRKFLGVATLLVLAASMAWAGSDTEGATTGEPVTLVQYNRNSGNISESPEIYAQMNAVLNDRIDVNMDFVDVPGSEYNQKISVVINSGESYDICFTSNWANNYLANVAKGAFADLTDLLPVKAPKYYSGLGKYWNATKVNGKIYAAINEQIFARSRMTGIPFDIVEKAGIDLPEMSRRALSGNESLLDLDYEMRKMIKPVIDDTYVMTAAGEQLVSQANLWDSPTGVIGSVRHDDAALKVFNQYDTPEFKNLLKYNRKLIDEGLLFNVDKTRTSEGTRTVMAEGKNINVIANGGTYKPGGQEQLAKRWQYLYLEVQMSPAFLTTGGIIATMLGVSSGSENVDKAVEWFEQINTDQDLYMLYHYGIEGKHYSVTDDGFMKVAEGSNYLRGVPWAMGNQFLQIPVEGQPKDVWEKTKILNESGVPSPLLGFSFDAVPVQSEMGQVKAVVDEYVGTLVDGSRDIEEYDDFLKKLKAAGSDRIIVELQKQIDAWK